MRNSTSSEHSEKRWHWQTETQESVQLDAHYSMSRQLPDIECPSDATRAAKRGLRETLKLSFDSLASHPLAVECRQLLALLSLCPEQTPWSLFDGGSTEHAALKTLGCRVLIQGQAVGLVSVVDHSCRIPKLKNLEAVAVSDGVKEGGKVAVRLSDGKTINVRGSDLVFEGDATAVGVDGHWMLPRRLEGEKEGRVMRRHADGSVSVLLQAPHEGCHVRLQGPMIEADLNGCFGYVCGSCDAATQRWPVRVMLPSNELKDLSLKADNLVCSVNMMMRNGSVFTAPAFASGWSTSFRLEAEEIRFKAEDVKRECDRIASLSVLCRLVHFTLHQLCAAMRFQRPPPLPMRIYSAPAPAPASVFDYMLAPAQLRHMLCVSGQLRFLLGVMVQRDVRRSRNRAQGAVLLRHVAGQSMALRLFIPCARGADGVLADTDALAAVAALVRSSGLVRVDEESRSFRTHKLIRKMVREEVGDAHDDAMAAMLEVRCGCYGDDERVHVGMRGVVQKVVIAAGYVLKRMKAVAPQRAAWVCVMRVRLLQMEHLVLGNQSPELYSDYMALDADRAELQALIRGFRHSRNDVASPDAAAGRRWFSRFFGDNVAWPDAAAGRVSYDSRFMVGRVVCDEKRSTPRDCRAELSQAQQAELGQAQQAAVTAGNGMFKLGASLYDARPRQIDEVFHVLRHAYAFYSMDSVVESVLSAQTRREVQSNVMSIVRMIRCIGISCSDESAFDRAIVFYEHALRICISFFGEMDAEAAETVTYLGIAFRWKGQYLRALELFERALRICLQVLGPDHRQTVWTQQCMHELKSRVAAIRKIFFRGLHLRA